MDVIIGTVIPVIVTLIITTIYNNVSSIPRKFKKDKKDILEALQVVQTGIQVLLRGHLKEGYLRACNRGYATISEKEELESVYRAYHNLGTNGLITSMREKFLALPNDKNTKR